MRHLFAIAVGVVGLAAWGCKGKRAGSAGGSGATSGTAASGAATDPAVACAGAEARGPLAWFEDDYQRARACALARHTPLVIDLWAPWCHTCISMQTTVLRDPSLAPLADRFVFVGLDTDRPANAAAVAQFPPQSWPTFYVVSPDDQTVQARWVGAASIGQVRTLLKDGETAYLASRGTGTLDPLLAKLRDADRVAVTKEWPAAAAAYAAVLAAAPADWPRRSDVVLALIAAQFRSKDWPGCLATARERAGETGTTANATDFQVWALECAGAEGADPEAARAVREQAVTRLQALVDDPAAPLSIDDRSDALMNLREALIALGREEQARPVAERQLELLADAAAAAPDAWTAMTYNWPRAEVHVYLQRAAELVPALEKSAADLPGEYDPPYRLAWVLMKSGQPAEALPWARKAARLAYGPRKVRVQSALIEIEKALGDKDGERTARQELVAVLEGLPPEAAQPDTLAKARADLAAMDAAAAAP